METMTAVTSYVLIECGHEGCGVPFALSEEFAAARRRDRRTWWCPNGHPRWYPGKTDAQKARDAQARARHLEDQLQAAENETEEARRQLLRERSRFARGVCPCCNRSFSNVRRHMADQHPDYNTDRVNGHDVEFACTCGDTFDTFRGLRTHQGRMTWGTHRTKV